MATIAKIRVGDTSVGPLGGTGRDLRIVAESAAKESDRLVSVWSVDADTDLGVLLPQLPAETW
jgi:hypothetical protein